MVNLRPELPRDDFEDGLTLLNAIGSFWAEIFEDNARLQTEFDGTAELYLQAQLNFLEAVAAVSRFDISVFHRERWRMMLLKKSALLPTAGFLKYGNGAEYGPQSDTGIIFRYGIARTEVFEYTLPANEEDLVDVHAFLLNRIIDPSVVLTKGQDFTINGDDKTIRFAQDPFKNNLFSRRPIYGPNDEIVDEELLLVVFQGDFDRDLIFNHFGYVLQVAKETSSEFYKAFINAYWNMFTRTPTLEDVRTLLAAITGIPTVIETEETVEFIEETAGKLQIITDQNVYKFQLTATPIVAIGDVLQRGDEMIDALEIIELSSSNSDTSEVPALALGKDFLSGGFFSQLIFENKIVELDYQGIDNDGKAFVKFEVSGFPGDEDLFWELAQQRGKDMGATLAELLDTRTNPPTDPSLPPEITQPGPEHLPLTVNPMEFMIDNLLKNNLFIIRLKPVDVNPLAAGLKFFHVLRSAIPPHTTFIVVVESEAPLEIIDLGQQGGVDACISLFDDEPGVQDEFFNDENCFSQPLINVFDGGEIATEEIGVTDPLDGTAWIEDAMVRPQIVEGELL